MYPIVGFDSLETIAQLLGKWGYWIVFLGVMIENAGIPVPGETILLASGFLASRGAVSIVVLAPVAAAGAICGDNIGYWVGRRLGRSLLVRYGKYVRFDDKRFHQMEVFFERRGDKAVAAARFFAGFRIFTALFAGASGMDWTRFLCFNAIGAITWAAAISLLGYFFGHAWRVLEKSVAGAGVALAAAVVGGWAGTKFVQARRRRMAKAKTATTLENNH